MKKTVKSVAKQSVDAVAIVKNAFHTEVIAGGGGRGGRSSTVLNRASRNAEMLGSAFADFFLAQDPSFNVEVFFRACCFRETFIERMERARVKHDLRTLNAAWKEAKRVVRKTQSFAKRV